MKYDGHSRMSHLEKKHVKERVGRKEGAKTFRRKRAIMFLEHLETKRNVLKKQLETPELQTANSIIVGELKATEAILAEFVQMFELYEFEEYAKFQIEHKSDEK